MPISNPKSKPNYSPAIDLLRTSAILAVILIHTSTRILESTHMDLVHHQSTLFLNQISRFAVPMFFIISGFVLELSFSNNYFLYFKKRVSKILVPYVFWSAIYFFFVYTQNPDNFFQALLSGSASYQLYFIPALLIFYFLFPLIHNTYNIWANKLIFVVLGLLQIRLLYLDYHLQGLQVYYPVNIALLNYFALLVGIWAFRNQEKILTIVKKIWPMLIIATGFLGYYIFQEGFRNYYLTYNFQFFYSQWRPSVLFYTLSLSALLYVLFTNIKLPWQAIKAISSLSFAVFFVHVVVLESIWKYWQPTQDLWFFLLVTTTSFTLSFIAHQIPRLAQFTG